MKKIIYLSTSLSYGGAETQLMLMAVLLKERGWDVKIVSMTPPTAYVEELEAGGVLVESLNIQRGELDLFAFFRFIKLLRSEKPDVLNTFLVHANFFGRLARLFVHVPVLVSSVRSIFEGGGVRNWWYKTTDHLCDMTTQVSRIGMKRFVDEKLAPLSKIVYIPNGVDTAKFRKDPAARSRLRRELDVENNFLWLAVGRFEKAKDYANMLRAFNLISAKTGCILLIVGDGSLYRDVTLQVKELGFDKVVRFLGMRRDIVDLMSAADAYLMSSAWEGMANVLLEAASCELPIVTTAVGENSALVLEGQTGFLAPAKDSEMLAQAMDKLMNLSLELRLCMGKKGRDHIEKK